MRNFIIPFLAILFVAFIITGCNNKRHGEDQEKTARTSIDFNKNDLTGIWLRVAPGVNPEEYKGFSLNEDGTLTYQNTPSFIGERWELHHDTLVLLRKSEVPRQSIENQFNVIEVADQKLTIVPLRSTNTNMQVYRKSEISLACTSAEEVLAAYIHFLNRSDATGIQSLMIVKRSFSISSPMNVTDYKILSTTKLTEEEAAAIPITPRLKEGDVQLEVEQVVDGSNTMHYTYWLREKGFGNMGLVIWSYKRGS